MSIFISVITLVLIISKFLTILKEISLNFFSFIRTKENLEKKRIKKILVIKLTFLLPWELINLTVTFIFAFFIFHLLSSSLIFVSLVSLLFKEIISEIPYLLLCTLFYLFKKPITLKEDFYIQKTGIIPNYFFSALYIPQKAESIADVYSGITQGVRTLKNNLKPQSSLIFIYHSDSEEDFLIEREIQLILEAKKDLGKRVFLFARNRKAYNPYFLRKPGGYMSDYQILNTGIFHPLTYVSRCFDARRQKVVSPTGKLKDHIPFYSLEEENQYFIHYKKNFFLKEKINIIKINDNEEKFEDIKISLQEYLINKENPQEFYSILQGKIFSPQGKLLFRTEQWQIDPKGKINVYSKENPFAGKLYTFIFVQVIYLNKEKRLTLDSVANLIDIETGEIWAKFGEYKVNFSYDLYKLKNKKLHLIKNNFYPQENLIKERDYRRLIFDRMIGISWESLKNLVKEKEISYSQAEEFIKTGIVGNIYNLHINKKGMEKEYFIIDHLINFKEKVLGGYLVRESHGFKLDKEGNLVFKEEIVEPKEKIKDIFIYEENEINYLMYEEKGEKFFVRYEETYKKVIVNPNERYFYISNPWINKVKFSDIGFVVNEKDGFYYDEENLWYIGSDFEKGSTPPVLVANREKIKKLEKVIISSDNEDNSLKKTIVLAEAGGWYRDDKNRFRVRKNISLRKYVYFDENLNARVLNPLKGTFTIYPFGSYTLGGIFLWQKYSEDDEIIDEEEVFIKDGNLVREELLAKKEDYYLGEEGEIILKNRTKFPYGIYLSFSFKNNEFLKDKDGRFIPADCEIKIVNQTDADAEFQPETIPYLNSKLIRNLDEEDPYLMLQPEISFGNQSQSIFARFHYWAQQMYRFTGRAIFSLYKESSAYGKMTKWIDCYIKNILFKETIPPLARTHDHWEAMHLKTALVYSHPKLKSKNLIENTPHNYFVFLKRLEGWLGGDLLLLEYETSLGVLLDFIRFVFFLSKINISEAKFWLTHIKKRIEHQRQKTDNLPHLSKTLRIWLIKRLAFSPLYYGLWLILTGTVSLIIPGMLTVKNPQLAWFVFWAVLTILICLPKIVIPLLERFLLFEKRKIKLLIFVLLIVTSFFINKLGGELFPNKWNKITTFLLFVYLSKNLVIYLFNSIFSFYSGLINRLKGIFISFIIIFFFWIYLPFLSNWLKEIPSAKWIFKFFLDIIPHYAGFLLLLIFLLKTISPLRITLELTKRGIIETFYSSSILLLNIIYVSLIVLSKIKFMIFNPHKTIPWFTSPFIEKILTKKTSLFENYFRLSLAPIVSLFVAILPVSLGLADPSLIFYGWPIFIWSWLFGPALVWFSGNFGRTLTFSSLEFLGIRDKIASLKNSLSEINKTLPKEKLIENILEYNLQINHILNSQELLRLFLYFFTDIEEKNLSSKIEKYLEREFSPENLREYDWKTLNELGRAKILLKIPQHKTHFSYEEINYIKAIISFIKIMGNKKLGFPPWEELSLYQQGRIIKKLFKRYKLDKEKQSELKKLLQFFENKELKSLYIKLKKFNTPKEFYKNVPHEFFYLKKAIEEIDNISSSLSSSHQRKFLIELISNRYNLKQKIYQKILYFYFDLIPFSKANK